MSDVPKSRVTLTYDTRQPEGREKPRELPFRLLVVGDLGGEKQDAQKEDVPLDARHVRQLNGRNLGAVMRSLDIKVPKVRVGEGLAPVDVPIESIASFSPDSILRFLTNEKNWTDSNADPAKPKPAASPNAPWKLWAKREQVIAFQKSYQNSKTLRAALKAISPSLADATKRAEVVTSLQTAIAAAKAQAGK